MGGGAVGSLAVQGHFHPEVSFVCGDAVAIGGFADDGEAQRRKGRGEGARSELLAFFIDQADEQDIRFSETPGSGGDI